MSSHREHVGSFTEKNMLYILNFLQIRKASSYTNNTPYCGSNPSEGSGSVYYSFIFVNFIYLFNLFVNLVKGTVKEIV